MHFIPVPAYASLGRRGAAFLIDSLILVIPCAVISHIIPAIGTLLVYFLYAPILEASEIRATLGKYALGIQVTDLTGKRISLWTPRTDSRASAGPRTQSLPGRDSQCDSRRRFSQPARTKPRNRQSPVEG